MKYLKLLLFLTFFGVSSGDSKQRLFTPKEYSSKEEIIQINRKKNSERENNYKYAYTSYQPSVVCDPAFPIQQPKTANDVKTLVNYAIKNGYTIKAVGHGGSRTDIICTKGIVMDMRLLKNMTYDEQSESVEVEAGAEIHDLLQFLHERNRALVQVPSFSGMTIGGAIGTEAHGSSLLHPSTISEQVLGLEILDGNGRERSIFRKEDLDAFKVHLGVLGIILKVKLRTVPQYKVNLGHFAATDRLLFNGNIVNQARAFDFLQILWFPSQNNMIISQGEYLTEELQGQAKLHLYSDVSEELVQCLSLFFENFQKANDSKNMGAVERFTQMALVGQSSGLRPILTEDGENVINPATGYSHHLLTSKCTRCRWNVGERPVYDTWSEVTIELRHLPEALRDIRDIIRQKRAIFPLFGIFIRFGRNSTGLMSTSQNSEVVHIEISSPQRESRFKDARMFLSTHQAIVQTLVLVYNGKTHWGKSGLYFQNENILKRNYPKLKNFQSFMKSLDRNGLFRNTFTNRLFGNGNNTFDTDPRAVHCALEDSCICRRNEDCGVNQQCTYFNGQRVCEDLEKDEDFDNDDDQLDKKDPAESKSKNDNQKLNDCKTKYLSRFIEK